MPPGGSTCSRKTVLNNFTVQCDIIFDHGQQTPNCSLLFKEEGNVITPSAIFINGRQLNKMIINTTNDWPNYSNVTINYDGLTNISVNRLN